jgi:hypothetical protein
LSPVQDRLHDVGCDAGQREEPADVSVRDTLLLREVSDRLRLTAFDLPTSPVLSHERLDPRLFGICRWGWGFSTSQNFNGDIGLIACFASAWTAAMVQRWHADPFGFLPPPRPSADC